MKACLASGGAVAILAGMLALSAGTAHAADPLPSWHAGVAKARIEGFVKAVTDEGSKDYVAPADRIAVFDNDGTLWAEQPLYFQLAFAIDRARAMVARNPALAKQPVMRAAAAGDVKALPAARRALRSWWLPRTPTRPATSSRGSCAIGRAPRSTRH